MPCTEKCWINILKCRVPYGRHIPATTARNDLARCAQQVNGVKIIGCFFLTKKIAGIRERDVVTEIAYQLCSQQHNTLRKGQLRVVKQRTGNGVIGEQAQNDREKREQCDIDTGKSPP